MINKLKEKIKENLRKNSLSRQFYQKYRLEKMLASSEKIKLHLGCGKERLSGYINIDLYPEADSDLILDASKLDLFPNESVDLIESYHFFEHLQHHEAKKALKEWFRVLKPGGLLILELPNLEICMKEIGKHFTSDGFDLALGGIFGQAPQLINQGYTQIHKWGWTPESLSSELTAVGFVDIHQHPIKQTWRLATAFNRDMQIRGSKPKLEPT